MIGGIFSISITKLKIDEICETCQHFKFDWRDIPFCCKGMNIKEYDAGKCGEYDLEERLSDWY